MDNDLLKSIHDDLQQIIQLLNMRADSPSRSSFRTATSKQPGNVYPVPSTRSFDPKEEDAILRIIASFKREDDNILRMVSPQIAQAIKELKFDENFKPIEKGYLDTVKQAITYLSPTPYSAEDIKTVIRKCPDMKFKADEKGKWYTFISSAFQIEYEPDY